MKSDEAEERFMPNYIDRRKFESESEYAQKFEPKAAEEKAQKKLPKNHRVNISRVNNFLGGAEQVQSSYAKKSTRHLNKEERDLVKLDKDLPDATIIGLALKHLDNIRSALGFQPTERVEFAPDPVIKKTKSGDRIVNVQQYYRGIPIFQMTRVVVLDKTGAIKYVDGSSISIPYDLDIQPKITLEDAMLAAAKYVASSEEEADSEAREETDRTEPEEPAKQKINLNTYRPKVLCRFSSTSQRAVLDKESFGEVIPIHLVFFYTGTEVRLGWQMIISTEDIMDQFSVIIEADDKTKDKKHPEVLFATSTASSLPAARGRVWTHNPEKNAGTNRIMTDFPRPIGDPIDPRVTLPSGFPIFWVRDNSDLAIGNNVIVLPEAPRGTIQDGILTFDPAQEQGPEQRALNAFYFCNLMHDFFYMLGFDESINLQQDNSTGNGSSGDPLEVTIFKKHNASLGKTISSVDGQKTRMRLFIGAFLDGETPRHSSLDAEVVFHEYTHAVTSRMVGGSLNNQPFELLESKGLSEGWSDYFALTVLNHDFDLELTTIMGWISDNKETGLRNRRYNDDFTARFGTEQPGPHGAVAKIGLAFNNTAHTVGEIWCAILMKMDRDLGKALGNKKRGHCIGWQIVFNGLLLLSANPTFAQARDGMIAALGELDIKPEERPTVEQTVRDAFAFFGL